MIIELRRYVLKPDKRATLTALFSDYFVPGQRATGIDVLGYYRDLDDPDLFVWVRSFPDNERRAVSLPAFYGGEVWRAHREAANATMIDSDNVLQLRPLRLQSLDRDGTIVATICLVDDPDGTALLSAFTASIEPQIVAAGGETLAILVTESSANPFPALPVREDARVVVWFARYPEADAPALDLAALAPHLTGTPETHRLQRP